MLKLIEEFSKSIDLQRSKVKKGTLKLTVFGGPNDSTNSTSKSQRSIFLLCSSNKLGDAFVVPENYKNWNHFGIYDDLLAFEEDICSASDSVLIFLESAGSIAEFGLLIKHPHIAQKLHVVIQDSFYQEDSFIKLGLLNHLKNKFDDSKIIVTKNNELNITEISYIVDLINSQFNRNSKEESFKQANTRHLISLIVDFIELLQVAEYRDIKKFLDSLSIKINKKRLEQLILTLKNIGLIREQTILSNRCFFISQTALPSIDYAFKPIDPEIQTLKKKSSPAKRITWKTNLFMESQEIEWRRLAFTSLRNFNKEAVHVS